MEKRRIMVFDTTLRDGEQTPGVSFHLSEKVKIAKALEALGVDIIEAGFANASKGDFDAISAIAGEIKSASLCSLARCVKSDITAAKKALEKAINPRLHLFIATSPIHMAHKLHMSEDEVFARAKEAILFAKEHFTDIEFSFEDATRSEPNFLCKMAQMAVDNGVTVLNIPDTVGYASVKEYGQLIAFIKQQVPATKNITLSVHAHNDLGLGVATSLEGLIQGANQVECTINGLGERAGNTPLEEVVMNLLVREDYYNMHTNIKIDRLYRTSKLVGNLSATDLAANKPILGTNAFVHQSGIHQHGVLNNPATYEIMSPQALGIPQNTIVLGKLSGRHALVERAKELGFDVPEEDVPALFERFKDLADRKKEVSDKDIAALLLEQQLVLNQDSYQLSSFQVFSGNHMTATATVSLEKSGDNKTRAACGDGPVEACYQAIDLITQVPCSLESYNLKAVTQGQDALGEVTVRIKHDDLSIMGKGVSTDILESSCLAYLNAVNRMIALLNEKNNDQTNEQSSEA